MGKNWVDCNTMYIRPLACFYVMQEALMVRHRT